MKTLSSTLFTFILSGFLLLQAQSFYISKNFEKKGLTEFLRLSPGFVVCYWTSVNSKEIVLKTDYDAIVKSNRLWVSFPGSAKKYQLGRTADQAGELSCIHPDGRVQMFEALPDLFVSEGYESPGVSEYLELSKDRKTFLYFTNRNKQQKIRLINIKQINKEYSTLYQFPGSAVVYHLEPEPRCLGDIICIHPDGRKQRFERYGWKK